MFVRDKEYRLTPGAEGIDGSLLHGATRVTFLSGPDGDGDLFVRLVDGSWSGTTTYIKPDRLMPAQPATDYAVGRLVTVLRDEDHYLRAGDIAEITREPDSDGILKARLVSGRGSGDTDWWIKAEKVELHPLDGGTPAPTSPSDTVDVNDILAGMAQ